MKKLGICVILKRTSVLILTLFLLLSFTACKSKAAKTADNLIASIGTVTLDSEQSIVAAEEAVSALTESEIKQIENLQTLSESRAEYDKLVAVQKIEDAIARIGEVTIDSSSKIANARKLYDNSTDSVQRAVNSYSILVSAEQRLSDLKVQNVVTAISDIGTVSLESENGIIDARSAYNSLSAGEQSKVENIGVLSQAESTLTELKEKAKAAAIAKLNKKTDKVSGKTEYKHPNYPYYINTRSFLLPAIVTIDNRSFLKIVYNYHGNDWVFWDHLTIFVDVAKYYKSFSYYDIDRDNYTDVWETAQETASSSDIEMLNAIADSQETIVRFEGDTYHYDLTVKSSDKKAIKETLEAWDYLK